MEQSGKLSLYKPASPLERGSLVQGKLQVSSPLVGTPTVQQGQSLTRKDTLADSSETTPTTTTEMWSSDLPAVQVVRHTPPKELPISGGSRFSSEFVQFQRNIPESSVVTEKSPAVPCTPDSERWGGGEDGKWEAEKGVGGVVRSVSDHRVNTKSQMPPVTDTSAHSKSADLSSIPEDTGSLTTKKKPLKAKGRVIPSRYMSSSKASTSILSSSNRALPVKPSTTTVNRTHNSKKSVKSAQKWSKKDDSFKMPSLPARSRLNPPPPSLSTTLPQHPFTPSAIMSSTPKLGVSAQVASQHHGSSFTDLSHNSSTRTTIASRHRTKVPGSSQSNDLELDLLYSRLLQATYLDVKSAKSLREQEETAKAQLHVLWEEVEGRRRECESLRRELETARRTSALTSVLDVQVEELTPLISVLPQLQQHHSALSRALDATRHELATSGVLPATEQQLEAELSQSERLLTEIVSVIRPKVPTVVSFADSTEAAVNTLEKEFQDLERCWDELSRAVKLQVHETSLTFERKQRQRSLHPTPPNVLTTCTE